MGEKHMFTRGGIFIRNPRIKFITDPETPGDGGGGDPAYPANTPVKDMTPEQQVAFHENKARRLEDKLKGFNGLTPDQVAALQSDLDAERAKSRSAEEKAIDDAREEGRTEVRNVLAAERVKNALDRALEGRIPNTTALLDLDRSQFVNGDSADAAAIQAWVEANSAAVGVQQKPFPDLFQGDRERVNKSDRETGKSEAEKRFGKSS